jgi:hypothetical protein
MRENMRRAGWEVRIHNTFGMISVSTSEVESMVRFLSEPPVDSNLTTSGSIPNNASRITFGVLELNNFVLTDA